LHAIQNFRRRRCRTLLAIERFTETLFHQPLANILKNLPSSVVKTKSICYLILK
jgi:hypothetical protein